jgi:hypothetical protein
LLSTPPRVPSCLIGPGMQASLTIPRQHAALRLHQFVRTRPKRRVPAKLAQTPPIWGSTALRGFVSPRAPNPLLVLEIARTDPRVSVRNTSLQPCTARAVPMESFMIDKLQLGSFGAP